MCTDSPLVHTSQLIFRKNAIFFLLAIKRKIPTTCFFFLYQITLICKWAHYIQAPTASSVPSLLFCRFITRMFVPSWYFVSVLRSQILHTAALITNTERGFWESSGSVRLNAAMLSDVMCGLVYYALKRDPWC